MRLPPPTVTLYCSKRGCMHATGIHVRWVPADESGPGWPVVDWCPHCRSELMDEPQPEAQEEMA
jgi:hypothetical protein